MMIAAHNPLIRIDRTRNFHDYVVQCLDIPVRLHFEVDLRRPGTHVIGHWQRASPTLRNYVAFQRAQQGLRVPVGNRQHRNLRQRSHAFQLQALGVFRGADPRCERIARVNRQVHHAATLCPLARPPRSPRKNVPFEVAVFVRIGIDDAAHRSMLGRDLRLDSTPGMEVARNHNRALHRYSHALKLLIVFGDTVVHVHKRRRDIAICRIGVVDGKLLGLLVRCGINLYSRLLQLGNELFRLYEFDHSFFRSREEDFESFYFCIETPFFEFRKNPLCIVLVVRRPNMVRPR